MQFKGDNRPPTPEIGRMLNVDAVVEGSVRRAGDTVRITAQLIDARADKHLWASSFERHSRDVLALQNELASAIAREINVQLTPSEQSRLAATPSVNPDAHDAYLKGRYFFNRPSDENLKKAIALFEEAVKLSPTFAPAYSGLSDAYLWAGYNEGVLTAQRRDPKPGRRPKGRRAGRQFRRGPHVARGLQVVLRIRLGRLRARIPPRVRAESQLRLRARSVRPGAGVPGTVRRSECRGERAAELDPLSPQILIDNSLALMFQGNVAAAKAQASRASELDPSYFFPPMIQGWVDINAGQSSSAIPWLKKAEALESPPFVSAWLAYAYATSGDRPRAMAAFEDLKKRSLGGKVLPFNLAVVHLGLGDHKLALDDLERAYASDSQWMGWLNKDRMFDPLPLRAAFRGITQETEIRAVNARGTVRNYFRDWVALRLTAFAQGILPERGSP